MAEYFTRIGKCLTPISNISMERTFVAIDWIGVANT